MGSQANVEERALGAMLRPQRASYELASLGPGRFTFRGKTVARCDFHVVNARGEHEHTRTPSLLFKRYISNLSLSLGTHQREGRVRKKQSRNEKERGQAARMLAVGRGSLGRLGAIPRAAHGGLPARQHVGARGRPTSNDRDAI